MSSASPRLTEFQWEAIRTHWEFDVDLPSGMESAHRAAKELNFKVPTRQSVHHRIRAHEWIRKNNMQGIVSAAHRKADRLVTSDGCDAPPPPPPEPPIPPEPSSAPLQRLPKIAVEKDAAQIATEARTDSEDKRAEVLARHRKEWRQVVLLRQEAVDERKHNMGSATDKARFAKSIAEVTKLQQEGERKAWGLDEPPVIADVSKLSDAELKALASGKGLS